MNKLVSITLAMVLLISLSATAVFAAPVDGGGPGDGTGYISDAMELAMAEVLGMDPAEFIALHDSGVTFYDIALDLGYTIEEIPALLAAARDAAVVANPVPGTNLGGGYNAPETAPNGTGTGVPAGSANRGGRR